MIGLTALSAFLWHAWHPLFLWPGLVFGILSLLGVYDLVQRRHSILRNYPVVGHLRWFFEEFRTELRQYFFVSDTEEEPFNRDERSLVYQRAKDVEDHVPFGTKLDVYEENYAWLNHSIVPNTPSPDACRVKIGGPECKKPYSASILNISAMSFGALSGNAIRALNKGARAANFAHDTGEGSISRYHRENGGDLIWELGTGYFGARKENGDFCPDTFKKQATTDQVKMVEIKLSQGAKPGHGGILPAAKVTREIAETRFVPMGQDVISPSRHSAFSTPIELMKFIATLRKLSGGKPTGFKLCVGHRWEFMAIVKAMLKTGIYPDFIVVDGAEGGTGAAPVEFVNHIGTPLLEGLTFVHNTLVGAGIRDKIKIGASGKIVTAFDMVRVIALGADYCNSARAFMFAIGCVQSLSCHTNKCPVGVATQDRRRQRALVVSDKAARVANYHTDTIKAMTEVLAAAGLSSPGELKPEHFYVRDGDSRARQAGYRNPKLKKNELLKGSPEPYFAKPWALAQAESFSPKAK